MVENTRLSKKMTVNLHVVVLILLVQIILIVTFMNQMLLQSVVHHNLEENHNQMIQYLKVSNFSNVSYTERANTDTHSVHLD